MSDTVKLSPMDELVQLVADDAQERAETCGGYPDEVTDVRGCLVVAGSCEYEPTLHVYSGKLCRKWLRDIRRSQKEYPEEDVCFHVGENAPQADIYFS